MVAVLGLCVPVALPQIMGYQVFQVVSGSMEPAIPVDSVLYVKPADLPSITEDEIIAYQHEDSVIAHRVVANRVAMGEFVTKGDANEEPDQEPVEYEAVIGRVEMHLPMIGRLMAIYTNSVGRIYLLLTAACGVMLNVLADRLREQRRAKQVAELSAAIASGTAGSKVSLEAASQAPAASSAPRKGRWILTVLMGLLAVIFIGSAGTVAYIFHGYHETEKLYDAAASAYTAEGDEKSPVPISVDFDALKKINPDVVGWIYCPGTPINYPVMQGTDDDFYLHHDYRGEYDYAGGIFVEADNRPAFADSHTIIFGHHEATNIMFTCLDSWQDQAWYDEHPVMWLLTPEQNYQVVLVSGHHTDAHSYLYEPIAEPGDQMKAMLDEVCAQSDFVPRDDVVVNPNAHYVMLSTCAYIFENARYVLHGELVPVE